MKVFGAVFLLINLHSLHSMEKKEVSLSELYAKSDLVIFFDSCSILYNNLQKERGKTISSAVVDKKSVYICNRTKTGYDCLSKSYKNELADKQDLFTFNLLKLDLAKETSKEINLRLTFNNTVIKLNKKNRNGSLAYTNNNLFDTKRYQGEKSYQSALLCPGYYVDEFDISTIIKKKSLEKKPSLRI